MTATALASGAASRPAAATDDPSVVRSVQPFLQQAGRAVWSPKGDKIAYAKREANGYLQLWIADDDLVGKRCVTCRLHDLEKSHVGDPTWHPSGDYLVARVERPIKSGGEPLRYLEVPGGNLGSDLYFLRADGRDFYNLTQLGERGGRVLGPRFSHEGSRLAWAERVGSGGGTFGKWVLRVASIQVKRGIPRLKDIRTFKPGETHLFFHNHGFTTDDRGLVFSGNLEAAQPESGLDIYRMDLESREVTRLTRTDEQLDRFALPSPNGQWIAFTSTADIGSGQATLERRQKSAVRTADLWMMNAEGRGFHRLTRFNDVHSPTFAGRSMVVPTGWHRDGDKLLALVLKVGSNEPGDLYLIELHEPIGR